MSTLNEVAVVNEQPLKKGLFLPPLLQLILGAIGFLMSGVLGLLVMVVAVLGVLQSSPSTDLSMLFSSGWALLLITALFIPTIVASIRRMSGKESLLEGRQFFLPALIALLLWVPLMFLGQWISGTSAAAWVLPVLQLGAVAFPIFFLIELGRRKLPQPRGSAGGVYSFGVILTHPIVLLAEILLLVVVVVGVGVWVGTNPTLMDSLERLGQRLMDSQGDPQMMLSIVGPFLQQPGVVYIVLALVAGVIPLMEELLKPLAIWIMVGRKFTAAEGFVLGLFAGGTFALMESLSVIASVTPEAWSGVLIGRVGTAILHVTSTSLVGWGLGSAWEKRKYLRLGLLFMLAFGLHAVWNTFGLLQGLGEFLDPANFLSTVNKIGPVILIIQAALMLLVLVGINFYLRRQAAALSAAPVPVSTGMPVEMPAAPLIETPAAEDVLAPEISGDDVHTPAVDTNGENEI